MAASADTRVWWSRRRTTYNVWLAGAGIVAFLSYCAIVWTGCPAVDEAEITAFTIVFMAFGYLVAMALANVFYFLGPLSESFLPISNPDRFRRNIFGLGVVFSVALPMLLPVSALFAVPRCH